VYIHSFEKLWDNIPQSFSLVWITYQNVLVVTLERAKELLSEYDLTDEQVEQIRDAFDELTDIIYEKWVAETHSSKNIYESKFEQDA
jgi:hypothetical protein